MVKIKRLIVLFVCIYGSFLFFSAGKVRAAMAYDPNNIIRDDVFTNSGSMSVTDIQNFLVAQNSCLATTTPIQLGSSNGQNAAQIIYQAATTANKGAGINPQVILTALQKEQSLITASCAALGNGLQTALNLAAGYDVPDVLGIGSCLYTFTAQMLGATCSDTYSYIGAPTSLRIAFDSNKVGPGGAYSFPTSFNVQQYSTQPGSIAISPASKATAVLFRYTPYAYYGNYNFFTIFQTFFGPPTCAINLQVIHNTGGVESSVLFGGARYPISSLEALRAWGLDCVTLTATTSSLYAAYPVGGAITRLFKQIDGSRVFIVQNGVRRYISTSLYVHQSGLDSEPYSELPSGLINALPEGNPMGYLVKAAGQQAIYLVQANTKYYVPNPPILSAWGFTMSDLITVNSTYLNQVPTVGTLSTLVKGGGADIFVASLGSFFYAPNLARLRDWNLQNSTVTLLDDAFLNSLPVRGTLSALTRGSGPDTYFIQNNARYYVDSVNTLNSLADQYGPTTRMDDAVIGAIPYSGKKP